MLRFSKTAEVSTAHATQEDLKRIAQGPILGSAFVMLVRPEGALLLVDWDTWAPDLALGLLSEGWSSNLVRVVMRAYEEECHYILLDADGPVYADLPQRDLVNDVGLFVSLSEAKGITPEDLDDIAHDIMRDKRADEYNSGSDEGADIEALDDRYSEDAADVNNGGLVSQIAFLIEAQGVAETATFLLGVRAIA